MPPPRPEFHINRLSFSSQRATRRCTRHRGENQGDPNREGDAMRGSSLQVIKFVRSIVGPIQVTNHILKTWLAGGDVNALGYISGEGETAHRDRLLYDDFCVANPDFVCVARHSTVPEPTDCDWPLCDCDPTAARVVEALQESGLLGDWSMRSAEDLRLREAIDELETHQRQLDIDGITVGVSREALDIVLAALGRAP